MVEYTIENVIATTDIKAQINLKNIAAKIDNVEYNPESFPGIVMRLEEPKTATFILRTGRTVCIGGKSYKESRMALETVVKRLQEADVTIEEEIDISIQNIIVSLDVRSRLNLNDIGELFNWKNISYQKDEFPGLLFNTELDNVNILVFDSGKLVCYGAKKLSEVNKVLDKFINRLHAVGMI